jgi:hypothetical protein
MSIIKKFDGNQSINEIPFNDTNLIIKTKINKRHETKDACGEHNGFLIPIYNIHEGFHDRGPHLLTVMHKVADPPV